MSTLLIASLVGIVVGALLGPFKAVTERVILKVLSRVNDGTSERHARLQALAKARGATRWIILFREAGSVHKITAALDEISFHGDEIIIAQADKVIIVDRRSSFIIGWTSHP